MKKLLSITAAVAMLAIAGSAFAAVTSDDLSVSASVVTACTAANAGNLAFGDLDPVSDPASTSTATKAGATRGGILVKCTAGTDYNLTATTTAMTDGTNLIAFSAVLPAVPANDGAVAGKTYTVDASVDKTAYASAPVGAYTGSMTVTVNY